MKATTLKRAIEARGGSATINTKRIVNEFAPNGREWTNLKGQLNGYDIEMIGEESTFFTAREVGKRGHYDAGSDYNSGGYTFGHTQNDLDWATR